MVKELNLCIECDEFGHEQYNQEKEKEQLFKQKEMLENEIDRSQKLLANENFIKKAPQAKLLVEKEKYENYLKQYEVVLKKIKEYV
jgi:valyl-tRNA synthetase